jgi:ABC-type Fe3+-hydroxamate transport system substrate-binding protein
LKIIIMQWLDALDKPHVAYSGTPRIVSLVPSLTELIIDLGLADALVGRTGFCVHPRAIVRRIPKVGGTKGFDLDKVRALSPTHVIVNIDENRREEVDALREALQDPVPHLIVTHPLGPRDNLDLYRLFGGIFGREAEATALCAGFEREWAALAELAGSLPRQKVLYLIWQKPWMTVSRDTYISRMLAAAGWETVCNAVPAESAQRYPEVDPAKVAGDIDLLLLSSEPFPFRQKHLDELASEPALAGTQIALIDGEMVSWYGSRAVHGLAYLRKLRAAHARVAGT